MNNLIVSDAPLFNFTHTNYAKMFSKYLIEKNCGNLFYLCCNLSINNENNNENNTENENFSLLNIEKIVNTFNFNDKEETIKLINTKFSYMNKIHFLIKMFKNNINHEYIEKLIKKTDINRVFFFLSFNTKIDKISNKFENVEVYSFYDTQVIPLYDNQLDLYNISDKIIIRNELIKESIINHYKNINENKIVLDLPLYVNIDELFNTLNNSGQININSNNHNIITQTKMKKKLNLPLNKKVLFCNIESFEFSNQETKLFDVHIRLFEYIEKKYPNEFYFVIFIPNDPTSINILNISNINKNNYRVINNFYSQNSLIYNDNIYNYIAASNAVICLSGYEELNFYCILANILKIPVFYNDFKNHMDISIIIGDKVKNTYDLFVGNKLQGFIKYPPLKEVIKDFDIFYKNYLTYQKYKKNIDNEKYNTYIKYFDKYLFYSKLDTIIT